MSKSRDSSIESENEELAHSSVLENTMDFSQYSADDLEMMIEGEGILSYDAECVRKKSNWGKTSDKYLFDSETFAPETLLNDLPEYSPKLHVLLKKIEALDEVDQKQHGKKFKHFVFSDLKSNAYGAKLLTSALIASGMKLGYSANPKKKSKKTDKGYDKIEFSSDSALSKTSGNNVLLLSSTSVYDQNITVALKKIILSKFNQRPDNVHGELARIIVMDSGFKEGIDLFDIKYIHIFEPSVVPADQKQVIGRGTRTCGQKGLEFHPTKGWPLHVFIYDLSIPEPLQGNMLGAETAIDLYMKAMNLDVRLFHFANDLEKATVVGSVDYDLNKAIHSFSIAETTYGGKTKGGAKRKLVIRDDAPIIYANSDNDMALVTQRLKHEDMKRYIKQDFSQYTWKDVKMENLCEDKSKGGASGQIMKYTPSQDFVRNYFTPANPVKGIMLWHSVGTGKTCSAIATATTTFEREGYTILWVTRTTLKNDIWKNMFDQVCNDKIADEIEYRGLKIPDEQAKRMKLLSKSWKIRPMSYKQFSNLVAQKNAFYKSLVKINGQADPLRKTLLIIDEAHKLYGGGDLSSIERPDMNELERALSNSYEISGRDSVKLLLMTATPITLDPMELIKLINLCKPMNEKMPSDFTTFSDTYLDADGKFTDAGRSRYLDDISGYVSYLNREKDARQFSQPQIQHINVPIIKDVENAKRFDKKLVRSYMNSEISELKNQIIETNKELKTELDEVTAKEFEYLYEKCEPFEDDKAAHKYCKKTVKDNIRELVGEAKDLVKGIRSDIKEIRSRIKNRSLFKKEAMEKIKDTIDNHASEYEHYKGSLFASLKDKCGIKINGQSGLAENVKKHDAMIKYDEQIKNYNQDIENLQLRLKQNMENYKNRIAFLKNILKKDLSELERSVIQSTVQDERVNYRKLIKATRKEIIASTKDIRKSIKTVTQKRKVLYNKIKKTVKNKIKKDRKEEKAVERAEKKLRKTLRKQGEYSGEIKDERLKSIIGKYSGQIDEQISRLSEGSLPIPKKTEKQIKAEEEREVKRQGRATRKEEKALEKALEKERVKAEKKAQKEEHRATKKAEKEREKELKKQARKTKKNNA